jgi:hypothetical protein
VKAKRPDRTLTLKETSGFGWGVEESGSRGGWVGWVGGCLQQLGLSLYCTLGGHDTVLLLGRGGRRRRRGEVWCTECSLVGTVGS